LISSHNAAHGNHTLQCGSILVRSLRENAATQVGELQHILVHVTRTLDREPASDGVQYTGASNLAFRHVSETGSSRGPLLPSG